MRSAGRRFGWGFVDQGVASLTTLAIVLSSTSALTASDAGQLLLGLSTVQAVGAIVRAVTAESLLVSSAQHGSVTREEQGRSSTVSIGIALIFAAPVGLIALLWQDRAEVFFGAMILLIPFVAVDCARGILIAGQLANRAAAMDATVLGTSAVALIVGANWGADVSELLLALACAYSAAYVTQAVLGGVVPQLEGSVSWIAQNFRYGSAFSVEVLLGSVMGYAVVVALDLFAGAEEVAAFRLITTVFGLTSLVINFFRSSVLRELQPRTLTNTLSRLRIWVAMTIFALVSTVATAIVLWVLPPSVSERLFGETWVLAAPLVMLATVERFLAIESTIPAVMLRALGVAWRAAALRAMVVVIGMFVSVGLVARFGSEGALVGQSLVYGFLTMVFSSLVRNEVRSRSGR